LKQDSVQEEESEQESEGKKRDFEVMNRVRNHVLKEEMED